MEHDSNIPQQDALLTSKLIHIALPVRWSLVSEDGRGPVETACTYDIHPQGARLLSSRDLNVGDLVMVERGRNKAICQVVWAADPASPLRGQFSVQCVEQKTPWDDELRQMEEQYQPVILGNEPRRSFGSVDANRRRSPRFHVQGQAEVIDGVQHVSGAIDQISEFGARITAADFAELHSHAEAVDEVSHLCLHREAHVENIQHETQISSGTQRFRRGDPRSKL